MNSNTWGPARVKKPLSSRYLLQVLAGFIAVIVANNFYPPLDGDTLFLIAWCAFLLPIILSFTSALRWGLVLSLKQLSVTYLCCGSICVLVALLIALNGSLDRSPVSLVKSPILKTSSRTRRYGGFNVFVASWRPGRSTEKLWVTIPASLTAAPGQSISIEIHKGFFNLPWYGEIKALSE